MRCKEAFVYEKYSESIVRVNANALHLHLD